MAGLGYGRGAGAVTDAGSRTGGTAVARRVLVVGSGGREHCLAWALSRAPSVATVEAVPGNPGTAELGPNHDVPVEPATVADLAVQRGVDLVVVGPEAPLVAGAADALADRGVPVFGPTAAGARIEGSKAFAKEVMTSAGVPTARYGVFDDPATAREALAGYRPPYVVKADGLAGGKGTRLCDTLEEARRAVDDVMVERLFGAAGDRVVLEEYLEGPEASVFGVADGTEVALLSPAQDFKRALDGDRGLNTGGMGAYTPVPGFGPAEAAPLEKTVFRPVLAELARRGAPYRGLLYAGLVLTAEGPKVLEFNCRFGDPEAQVVVPRLQSDLGELLWRAATGSVASLEVAVVDDAFVTVVLASGGYPGPYETGVEIHGVEEAAAREGATVFHAGTRREGGRLLTDGGRVLDVTGQGPTVAEAREVAYGAADLIHFRGRHRREDIAELAATAGRA